MYRIERFSTTTVWALSRENSRNRPRTGMIKQKSCGPLDEDGSKHIEELLAKDRTGEYDEYVLASLLIIIKTQIFY